MNFCIFIFLIGSIFVCCNAGMTDSVLKVFDTIGKCNHDTSLNLDVNNTVVYFYDFKHDACQKFSEKIGTITDKIFRITKLDKNRKIVIFVPGFQSNIKKKSVDIARKTFKDSRDIYLMILDHSQYTNADSKLKMKEAYENAVKYVYYIGKALGNMLTTLVRKGISAKNIHCIGHSLGSHMVGQAGLVLLKNTRQKIARITALDPARPCFKNTIYQVHKGMADYVEVYHCNAGVLGIKEQVGDVDYFINDGTKQPNCPATKKSICSHTSCVYVYFSTIRHHNLLQAQKCSSIKKYRPNCYKNQLVHVGYKDNAKGRGLYYISTKDFKLDKPDVSQVCV